MGRAGGGPLVFYLFDLLHRDGWDLRPCPLVERKAALAELLKPAPGQLLFSDHRRRRPRLVQEAE